MDEIGEGFDVGGVGFAQAKCDDTRDGEFFNEGFKHLGTWEEEGVNKERVKVKLSGNKLGNIGGVRLNKLVYPASTPKHCDSLSLSCR